MTAGLKCPPEMCPTAEAMTAITNPCANATPTRPEPVMIAPAPTNVSAKAPTNSAALRRKTSPSTPAERRAAAGQPTSLRPVGLVFDADGLGDPVDVVEVGDDLDRIVDRGVAPPLAAQARDVRLTDGRGPVRQEHGEVAERANPRLELRLPVVVGGVLRQLVCCALGTEVVGVRANSVMAVVRARNDDGEELSLGAGKLRRART